MSWQFLLTSNKSELEINLNKPLELTPEQGGDPHNYEIGLVLFSVYNIIFNITNVNNKFKINNQEKSSEPGVYQIKTIAEKLLDCSIILEADLTTGKSILRLISPTKNIELVHLSKPEYKNISELILEFSKESFFHEMLGYLVVKYILTLHDEIIKNDDKIKGNNITSENRINIMDSSLINITSNLISSNYINNQESNILYSFPVMSVSFGYKISEKPSPIIYSRVNTNYISRLTFRVEDEHKRLLDFNKEKISLLVHLRKSI